ncbi:MAG: carboxylating nicotinate-nucleotide diphosphorylase [Armatimonadota bacterium]
MKKYITEIIKTALKEDKVKKDLTTKACIPKGVKCRAVIIAKQKGILAGIDICRDVFKQVDPRIVFNSNLKDGDDLKKESIVAEVSGKVDSILIAERCALNFLSFLSGIATKTKPLAGILKGKNIKVLDTRKTLPGLRFISKYAVKTGGGKNHRMNLSDGILIKDNHLKFCGINKAVKQVREKFGRKYKIEVECENLVQVKKAVSSGADIIMLDNMNIKMMKKAVKIINGKSKIEVSGGITEQKLKKIKNLPVDYISMGSITNNIDPLDFSLEIKIKDNLK